MAMTALPAFVAGLVFGIGLLVSRMANPAKVLAFLDLAGAWDPSLLLVMAAAVPVAAVGFLAARRRGRTLLGGALALPDARDIDAPLVLGSLAFGVGWGLVGVCPGPALVLLGTGRTEAVIFVLAMLAGMAIHALLERSRLAVPASPAQQNRP